MQRQAQRILCSPACNLTRVRRSSSSTKATSAAMAATASPAREAVERSSSPASTSQPAELLGRDAGAQLLSVAPMMDWTDVHYRQLARLISRHTWLYTEMVVDNTLLHQPNRDRWLWFPPDQHPIVCQLGGSNPTTLAAAAAIVEQYGYDEINLNCGCPSDRVAGAGCFGAAMMLRPEVVAQCCAAMQAAVSIPVTVKCRLGVDDHDSYPALCQFIRVVSTQSRVTHFIIHARKCLLKGLSPHENRTIPPLRYEWVYALKRDFPHLSFSLNGGVQSCQSGAAAMQLAPLEGASLTGVMIGRAAYNAPWACLADADRTVFGQPSNMASSRQQVLEEYGRYADSAVGRFGTLPKGGPAPGVRQVLKPLLALFHGDQGCKRWKQAIDKHARSGATASAAIQECMKVMPPAVLAAPPKSEGQPAPFMLKDALPVLLHEEQQAAQELAAAETSAELQSDGQAEPQHHQLHESEEDQQSRVPSESEQTAKRQRTMTACA